MAKTIASTTISPLRLNFGEGVYAEDAQAVSEMSNYAAARTPQSFLWTDWDFVSLETSFTDLFLFWVYISEEDETAEFWGEIQPHPNGLGSPATGTHTLRFNLNSTNTDLAFTRTADDNVIKVKTFNVSSLSGWYLLTVSASSASDSDVEIKAGAGMQEVSSL